MQFAFLKKSYFIMVLCERRTEGKVVPVQIKVIPHYLQHVLAARDHSSRHDFTENVDHTKFST